MNADSSPVDWETARRLAYEAGRAAAGPAEVVPLDAADGRTLAEPLLALTDLPAFPTSSIDGWAVRGRQPWRPVGQVLAGGIAPPLDDDGTCLEIATGAMVPAGAEALIRIEESTRDGAGLVSGAPRLGARMAAARRGGHQGRGTDAGRHRGRPGGHRCGRDLRLRVPDGGCEDRARPCWSSATSC